MKFLSLILLIFTTTTFKVFAKSEHLLLNNGIEYINEYQLLPNQNYSFNEILSNTNLPFLTNDSIKPNINQNYWMKIKVLNNSKYAVHSIISVFPQIDNTLFYYNLDSKTWVKVQNGLNVSIKKRNYGALPIILNPNQTNTIYIKIEASKLAGSLFNVVPSVFLENEKDFIEREKLIYNIWVIAITIVLVYFLYSFFIYFILKDITYLYYIIILLGSIIYFTSAQKFFNELIDFRYCTLNVISNHNYYFYDLNSIINRISLIFIVFGFSQLTRSFLGTKLSYPKLDKILIRSVIGYITLIVISIFCIIFNFLNFDIVFIQIQNLMVLYLFILIIYTAIKSYLGGNKLSKYFLIANLLPITSILLTALYLVIYKSHSIFSVYLPNIGLITLTITFAIALVGRFKIIKSDLQTKELETVKLQKEKEKVELQNELKKRESEQLAYDLELTKYKNDNLELKLASNQRELVSSVLYASNKNEMLTELKKQIGQLSKPSNKKDIESLKKIKSIIQNNLSLDTNWEKFKIHFEQVHPDFFKNLLDKYPNLTPNELRLSAYLHLNLSIKEIASLQNIDPGSVRRAKTRLNNKLKE